MTAPPAPAIPTLARPAPRTGSWLGAAVARGLLGGIALGAAYRGFMRLVSTSPSFTWTGTLTIVGSVTVVVLLISVTAAVRRHARSRAVVGAVRVVGGASFLLLAAGPGVPTVPVWLLGGLALGRTTWRRGVRIALGAVAVAAVVALVVLSRDDLAELGTLRAVAGLAMYCGVMAVLARLFAVAVGDGAPYAAPGDGREG
jgi:hypothetical protein